MPEEQRATSLDRVVVDGVVDGDDVHLVGQVVRQASELVPAQELPALLRAEWGDRLVHATTVRRSSRRRQGHWTPVWPGGGLAGATVVRGPGQELRSKTSRAGTRPARTSSKHSLTSSSRRVSVMTRV